MVPVFSVIASVVVGGAIAAGGILAGAYSGRQRLRETERKLRLTEARAAGAEIFYREVIKAAVREGGGIETPQSYPQQPYDYPTATPSSEG